jgi:hypothetical protein
MRSRRRRRILPGKSAAFHSPPPLHGRANRRRSGSLPAVAGPSLASMMTAYPCRFTSLSGFWCRLGAPGWRSCTTWARTNAISYNKLMRAQAATIVVWPILVANSADIKRDQGFVLDDEQRRMPIALRFLGRPHREARCITQSGPMGKSQSMAQRPQVERLLLWVRLGRIFNVRGESAFPTVADIVDYGRDANSPRLHQTRSVPNAGA